MLKALARNKRRFALVVSVLSGLFGGAWLVLIALMVRWPVGALWIVFVVGALLAGVMNWRGLVRLNFFEDEKR